MIDQVKTGDYFIPRVISEKVESSKTSSIVFLIIGIVGLVIGFFGVLSMIIPWFFGAGFGIGGVGIGIVLLFIGGVSGLVGFIAFPLMRMDFTEEKEVYLDGKSYDALVRNGISVLGSNPRTFVGLDPTEIDEIAPIVIEGYKFEGASRIRKDHRDNLWRSDLYERAIIFFTLNEIHIYKCYFNSLTGKITETTDVLFYEDIVSVSTKNEVYHFANGNIEYISFNLTSKGGNSMSIAIDNNKNVQNSINAMRAMIKEKKIG